MKKLIYILIGLFLGSAGIALAAAPITFPINGGTGTSTPPTYGQLLVGNSGGTYTLTATSSLGFSGGSGTNYFTNSGATTTLNTGSTLTAGILQATSTGSTQLPSVLLSNGTGLYSNGSTGIALSSGSSGITWDGGELYPNATNLKNIGISG